MKIRMLTTEYDEETNTKIWDKGDEFIVKYSKLCDYYIVKNVNDMEYGIEYKLLGEKFEIIE